MQWWDGPLGQEYLAQEYKPFGTSPNTCEKHNHTEDDKPKLADKLLDGHGYLWPPNSGYTSDENIPVQLLNAEGETVAVLPFGHKEMAFAGFYLFKQAYFIVRDGLKTTETDVGWWLYPDGRVEVMKVPPRAQLLYEGFEGPSGGAFFPTKVGIFISHHYSDMAIQGGYLAQKEELIKVINARLYDEEVSPDGCRIAFKYEPDKIDGGKSATLRFIELCGESKK